MGKVIKPILGAALFVGAAIVTGGISVAAAAGVALSAGAVALQTAAAIAMTVGLNTALRGIAGNRNAGLMAFDPRAINVDKAAPRKMVFGQSIFPLDMRYAEPSGKNQEYVDYVFALAGHRSQEVSTIYIEEKLAWTAAGGAQGDFAGFLWIEVILEAGPGAYHTVNSGSKWGAAQRMTGCTTMKVRVKRSGEKSPFQGGVGGRWSVIGRGMPIYDPAYDSTVPGGIGPQRAGDCSTWDFSIGGLDRGANPALQLLAYLLGWRVNGVVSVGLGLDPSLIDLRSFAMAAAICDESVALADGLVQRRYQTGGVFADADDPDAVIQQFLDAMNGELVDGGDGIGLRIATASLSPVATFGEEDFLSGYSWTPEPPLDAQFTVVRGQYSQPGAPSLYALADYPEVQTGRASVAPRPAILPLPLVQDIRRAERIATQVARRSRICGEMQVTVGIRGWLLKQHDVVGISIPARGWAPKLFRVRGIRLNIDGDDAATIASATLTLREEDASIYAWDTSETGNLAPVPPVPFDTGNLLLTANGLSIASVPAVINVALFPNGSPKPAELPKSTQVILYDGATDVTADAAYAVLAQENCTAAHVGGGLFTLSSVSGLPASFTVQADYDGRAINQKISVAAPKDGAAASRNSTLLGAPASGATLSSIGFADLVVAAGATVSAGGGIDYRAATGTGTRTVSLAAAVSIENLTDAGAPVFSSESIGSEAVWLSLDGDSEVGYVAASLAIVNGTGQPKTFRCRFYTRKAGGNSTARTAPGDYLGNIEVSAA